MPGRRGTLWNRVKRTTALILSIKFRDWIHRVFDGTSTCGQGCGAEDPRATGLHGCDPSKCILFYMFITSKFLKLIKTGQTHKFGEAVTIFAEI